MLIVTVAPCDASNYTMNLLDPSTRPSVSLVIATQSGTNLITSSKAGIAPVSFESLHKQTTRPSKPISPGFSPSFTGHWTSTSQGLSHSRLQSLISPDPSGGTAWKRLSFTEPRTVKSEI